MGSKGPRSSREPTSDMNKTSRIGIGFVGAGWMGEAHLQRLLARDDVEIRWLFEPNEERGREVLSRLGLGPERLARSYDQMLADPSVHAVWIASPNCYHGPQAIQAMEAGKHVFCEKPPATTFAEFCREIEIEQAKPELITMVDYILRFDPMETRLREMVARGTFGRITQIQVNYRHPVNISGTKNWKLKAAIMGDAIGMGINHALSVMLDLMAPQTAPVGVFAISHPAEVRGFESDPIWTILVRFADGAVGVCCGNIDNGNGYDAFHSLFGTQGGFVFDSQQDRAHKVRYWSETETGGRWVFPLDPERCAQEGVPALAWPADLSTPDSGDVMQHQIGRAIAHFLDCVRTRTPSPLSFSNARLVGEVGWAARVSAKLGREVRLPLDWAETARQLSEGASS